MRTFWIILGVIVLLVALFFGYQKIKPLSLKTVPVESGKAIEAVYATGTVEAKDRATIRSKISGTIVEFSVEEGSSIQKGQFLLKIDAPSLNYDVRKGEAELLAAKQRDFKKPQLWLLRSQQKALQAELAQARLDLKKAEELYQKSVIPIQELERAKTKVTSARAQVNANIASQKDVKIGIQVELQKQKANVASLAAKYGDAEIHSPMEGIILSRKVELGETVSANQELLRIGDVKHLWIEAQVGEEDIGKVRLGMPAVIRFYAFGQRTFSAHVKRIFPDANRDLKSFEVDLELDGAIEGLLSGMTCEIDIITNEKEKTLLIPTEAVLDEMVWVVQDGKAKHKKVKTGIRDLKRVEILEGLSIGEHVILGLEPGQKIEDKRVDEAFSEKAGK